MSETPEGETGATAWRWLAPAVLGLVAIPAIFAIGAIDMVVVNATVHPLSPMDLSGIAFLLFAEGGWPFVAVAAVVGLAVGAGLGLARLRYLRSRGREARLQYWPIVVTWALAVAVVFAGTVLAFVINAASSGL